MAPRFLSVADVAEVLNVSARQVYALLRTGELPGIQLGGRGIWRIDERELDAYIQRGYATTRSRIERGELPEDPPAFD